MSRDFFLPHHCGSNVGVMTTFVPMDGWDKTHLARTFLWRSTHGIEDFFW